MKVIDTIVLILIIIGAINWGLLGFFQFDLVAAIFGEMSTFSRIIYAIIGICGLYSISFFAKRKERIIKYVFSKFFSLLFARLFQQLFFTLSGSGFLLNRGDMFVSKERDHNGKHSFDNGKWHVKADQTL